MRDASTREAHRRRRHVIVSSKWTKKLPAVQVVTSALRRHQILPFPLAQKLGTKSCCAAVAFRSVGRSFQQEVSLPLATAAVSLKHPPACQRAAVRARLAGNWEALAKALTRPLQQHEALRAGAARRVETKRDHPYVWAQPYRARTLGSRCVGTHAWMMQQCGGLATSLISALP